MDFVFKTIKQKNKIPYDAIQNGKKDIKSFLNIFFCSLKKFKLRFYECWHSCLYIKSNLNWNYKSKSANADATETTTEM